MPRLPISEQALRLATSSPSTQYVCRTCRAQATRQFSVSSRAPAELPFLKRLQNSVFGTKETHDAEKKREELHKQRVKDLAGTGAVEEEYVGGSGKMYKKASLVDPSVNERYVQSTDWQGLERVGGVEWVRSRRDEGEAYTGFNPRRKLELTNQEWQVLLHHVAVQVVALYQAGRDLNDITNATTVNEQFWRQTASAEFRERDGKVSLQFMSTEDEQLVLQSIPTSLAAEAEMPEESPEAKFDEMAEPVEAQEAASGPVEDAASNDIIARQTYRDLKLAIQDAASQSNKTSSVLSLEEPAIKLAILKRVFQLSNHRLPDPIVSRATTLSDFYHAYITKPAPKRLAQSKELRKLNVTASNVTVHSKRQTPIHKDKAVGRWKVIEEELLRRRLPVTGSRFQDAKTTSPV